MDQSKLNSLKPAQAVALSLLERAAEAPSDALVSLAQLYRAYIKGWARPQISRELRRRFQSSTVAQETLLRIQAQSAGFETRSLAEFENYLLKTAQAVIRDLTRRHLAKRRSILREVPIKELDSQAFWNIMRSQSDPGPGEAVEEFDENRYRLEQIRTALLTLKPHYQKVIREYYQAGKTVEEIAAVIDRSPDATRMLITRALKALQKKLQVDGSSSDE
jgi:RNA polymerase sigma factor (sigma-70 family)